MSVFKKPLRIYLVRHGETDWTLSGRFTGNSDIPLTSHGEDDARSLHTILGNIPFGYVFCSPQQRARKTCELAELSTGYMIDEDLSEWDYGAYEGEYSIATYKKHKDWNIFRDGCPQGETASEVSARVDKLLARIRMLNGSVGIFSHGHLLRVIASRWIDLPISHAINLNLDTASISILTYDPHHNGVPVINLWNKVARESR